MKPKLKLGQILYSLNVGNSAIGREQKLTPCEVTKIGRKYFEITFKDHWRGIVFHIDTWSEKTEYSSYYCLYVNPQEWEDEKESERIYTELLKHFTGYSNHGKISLEKLKQIEAILKEN